MSERRREADDVERVVDEDDDRDEAVISADDTGMIAGERQIFEGEQAQADEESE